MGKNRKAARSHSGLQVITLCISTSMVLVLLGLVVMSVGTAYNLANSMRENVVVTMMLREDMTSSEARQLCTDLRKRPYISSLEFISKEQVLREQRQALGTDPSEFIGGNPYQPSVELHLKADYANNDSLRWISSELRQYPKVGEITYPQDLISKMNKTLSQFSIVLLVLAVLLTFVSFSLVNNTVRLGIYARRFSIHTMKLVGASWSFIRRPFVRQAVSIGIIAAVAADAVLAACVFGLTYDFPDVFTVLTWPVLTVTGVSVILFGIIITALCASISVNKFLKMKAGDLYKI